jgi:hypothetical protein
MARIKYIKPQSKEYRIESAVILASSKTININDVYTDIGNNGNDFEEND